MTDHALAESAARCSRASAEERTADAQVPAYQMPACSATLAVYPCLAKLMPRPVVAKAGLTLHALARVVSAVGLREHLAASGAATITNCLSIAGIHTLHRYLLLELPHPAE